MTQSSQLEKKIRHVLKENDLTGLEEEIVNTLVPCIRIKAQEEEELTFGTSKFGGYPDLPPGMDFPRLHGEPLSFIGQYNLREIKQTGFPSPLPDQGMLYFFCSLPPSEMKGQVLYTSASPNNLYPVPFPDDLPRENCFPEYKMKFVLDQTLPNVEAGEEMDEVFYDLMDQLYELENQQTAVHQIFGLPFEIDRDVFQQCEAESGKTGHQWNLLLQIDSDEQLEMVWGDLGILYFCISEKDLKEENFPETQMVMQSYG